MIKFYGMVDNVQQELKDATDRILQSESRKKLIVAGPGSGKTYIFGKLLEQCAGEPEVRLVLTFINNLKEDLDRSLGHIAHVSTLHGYCQHLLYQCPEIRGELVGGFICFPGLVSLIKKDWEWLQHSEAPQFVDEMRRLDCPERHEAFYFARSEYYEAVDFDDSVYRVYRRLSENEALIPNYELVLIDEFQDFNALEAGIVGLLSRPNPIVLAGDDDQALYSQLRSASWDHIRAYYHGADYDVYDLPFCMRCTQVVVDAVNDVFIRARATDKLVGRIDKPYRFYEPQKGNDSGQYPTIDLVRTSVQRANANYFGRFIEQAIRAIPEADNVEATKNHEPVALVIGPRQYLRQIQDHLVGVDLYSAVEEVEPSDREKGLEILRRDAFSNLGWRIILACGDEAIAVERLRAAAEGDTRLFDLFPEDERDAILEEAAALELELGGDELPVPTENDAPNIKLTSFEGSKGMSAQHVFLVGLHDGDLPRNAQEILDIEICRFVVGLTRTKKKCSLLYTQNFAGNFKDPSQFLNWIDQRRFNRVEVDRNFWQHSR